MGDRNPMNDLNLKWESRISVILAYGVAIAGMISAWWWGAGAIAAVLALLLLALNAPVYRFFCHKRGKKFALKTIPWHWLYYLYSGLAFAIGTTRHLFHQFRTREVAPSLAKKYRLGSRET